MRNKLMVSTFYAIFHLLAFKLNTVSWKPTLFIFYMFFFIQVIDIVVAYFLVSCNISHLGNLQCSRNGVIF